MLRLPSGRLVWLAPLLLTIGLAPSRSGADTSDFPGERLVLDLAAHLERAHLRSAGSLVIDLGTPSRHKHTVSDWQSGWSGDFVEEGTTFSRISGWAAWLWFEGFEGEKGGGSVAIRARTDAARKVLVRLNGHLIGSVSVQPGGFVTEGLDFPAGLVEGANTLMIQPVAPGRDDAGLLEVDRVVVSPTGAQLDPDGDCDEPRASKRQEDASVLELADGDSATYHALLPQGRLFLALGGEPAEAPEARLTVAVRADEWERPVERSIRFLPGGEPVEVPLEIPAGGAVEITLSADGGNMRLTTAHVVDRNPAETFPIPSRTRNVAVIVVDTLRADRLGIYNPVTRVRTPEIDVFGAKSIVFERATAPGAWTKPSVASLLTGLFTDSHGVEKHESTLSETVPYMPEVLRDQGLQTAGFVGNGYISGPFGFERGWDTWRLYGPDGSENRARNIVDGAVSWLSGRSRNNPYFLYVHLVDPHAPYAAPGRYRDIYSDPARPSRIKPSSTAALLRSFLFGMFRPGRADLRRLKELYDAEITYIDHHIGRLVRALGRDEPGGGTLVFLTADHGEEFMEHGHLGHGQSLHDEVVRVPLIVGRTGEASTSLRRSMRDVSLVDILPTACDQLGIDCPGMEGRSLYDSRRVGEQESHRPSFASLPQAGQRLVRSGGLKLIATRRETKIYDLEEDIHEQHDVSEERPVAAAALRDALGDHLRRVKRSDHRKQGRAELDDATRKQLEALGYLDSRDEDDE